MPSKLTRAKVRKRPGMGLVEGRERFLEPVAPAAVEIDHRPHAGLVHLGQVGCHASGVSCSLPPPR